MNHPEIFYPRVKAAITTDDDLLARLARLAEQGEYPFRSQATQEAIERGLEEITGTRLVKKLTKLDPGDEGALADEGLEKAQAN